MAVNPRAAAREGKVVAKDVSKMKFGRKALLGGAAAAIGFNVVKNRHRSGVTAQRGRPTGPYMY